MLTKAQKMKMVSEAIDKGFKVELVKHDVEFQDSTEFFEVFPGLIVESNGYSPSKHAWFCINPDEDDQFEATLHLK